MDITSELYHMKAFPVKMAGHTTTGGTLSPVRLAMDRWHKQVGESMQTRRNFAICGETGDGHFLKREPYPVICKKRVSMDAFDARADLKLNLMKELSQQKDKNILKMAGTLDMMVSHQVIEHVAEPLMAIGVINAMLSSGGLFIFSMPFIAQDHRGPTDFQRYTVEKVDLLLSCGGFQVDSLIGWGSALTSIAFLAGVGGEALGEKDLQEECKGVEGCYNKVYSAIFALATKKHNVTFRGVSDCAAGVTKK